MDNIYMLSDTMILLKIGSHLKSLRLKQNITQQSLAESAGVSLSSLKKIEKGEICSFDSFLRTVRTLGVLDTLQPLVEDAPLSPSEYYELMQTAETKNKRQRATRRINKTKMEDSEW